MWIDLSYHGSVAINASLANYPVALDTGRHWQSGVQPVALALAWLWLRPSARRANYGVQTCRYKFLWHTGCMHFFEFIGTLFSLIWTLSKKNLTIIGSHSINCSRGPLFSISELRSGVLSRPGHDSVQIVVIRWSVSRSYTAALSCSIALVPCPQYNTNIPNVLSCKRVWAHIPQIVIRWNE